jgi:hypothetical protein
MLNTTEMKSIANGLLNALHRRKVGGAKFSTIQEVVGKSTSVDDANESGDIDVKVQEELNREELMMMDEGLHNTH